MKRAQWRDLYRIARQVRKKGHFTRGKHKVTRLGSGIEKVAYSVDGHPGWILKVGGASCHAPEDKLHHIVDPLLRPRTVFLPCTHLSHTAAVQIQEEVIPLQREQVGCGGRLPRALKPLASEAQECLERDGITDTHYGNLGFSVARGQLVVIDFAAFNKSQRIRWARYESAHTPESLREKLRKQRRVDFLWAKQFERNRLLQAAAYSEESVLLRRMPGVRWSQLAALTRANAIGPRYPRIALRAPGLDKGLAAGVHPSHSRLTQLGGNA